MARAYSHSSFAWHAMLAIATFFIYVASRPTFRNGTVTALILPTISYLALVFLFRPDHSTNVIITYLVLMVNALLHGYMIEWMVRAISFIVIEANMLCNNNLPIFLSSEVCVSADGLTASLAQYRFFFIFSLHFMMEYGFMHRRLTTLGRAQTRPEMPRADDQKRLNNTTAASKPTPVTWVIAAFIFFTWTFIKRAFVQTIVWHFVVPRVCEPSVVSAETWIGKTFLILLLMRMVKSGVGIGRTMFWLSLEESKASGGHAVQSGEAAIASTASNETSER